MEYEEVVTVFKSLPEKYLLGVKEKEALLAVIGILMLATTTKSKIRAQKAKREKVPNGNWLVPFCSKRFTVEHQ